MVLTTKDKKSVSKRTVTGDMLDELNEQINEHFQDMKTQNLKNKYDILDEVRRTRNVLMDSIGLRDKIENLNERVKKIEGHSGSTETAT